VLAGWISSIRQLFEAHDLALIQDHQEKDVPIQFLALWQ